MELNMLMEVVLPARSPRDIVYLKRGINNYSQICEDPTDRVFYVSPDLAGLLGYHLDGDLSIKFAAVAASDTLSQKRVPGNITMHAIIHALNFLDKKLVHCFDYRDASCIRVRYNMNREKWYIENLNYNEWLKIHEGQQLKNLQVYKLVV